MPFNIQELFINIIKNYNFNSHKDFDHICKYIPYIVQFNRISKIHYQWMKNITYYDEIKYSLIWLNAQTLRKTIHTIGLDKGYIEAWAAFASNDQVSYIPKEYVHYSVLLYNYLNIDQIIGNYPRYNINYKFSFPDAENVLKYGIPNTKYSPEYKNFPKPTNIIYHKRMNKILYYKSIKNLSHNDMILLQYRSYLFRWMSEDRPF